MSNLQQSVREVVDKSGLASAAKSLGVSREAITRVLADLPVRAGTAALIEQNLKALKDEKKKK